MRRLSLGPIAVVTLFACGWSAPPTPDASLLAAAKVPLYPNSFAPATDPDAVPDQLVVEVTIDDVEHVLLRLDSAAPSTSMTQADATALGLAFGTHDIWLGDKATGVHVGMRAVVDIEAVGDGPLLGSGVPPGAVLHGTAGTDLWFGNAIGIDVRGHELWVMPHDGPLDGSELPHPDDTGDVLAVPATFARHAPGDTAGVLYTRVSFDAGGATGGFLVDTGTNTNLALGAYWQNVTPASPRVVPFDGADFEGNPLPGGYQLGSAYVLGGHMIDTTQPVWVLSTFPVLASEGQYFNQPTDGLVSTWGLFRHFSVLDFGAPDAPDGTPRLFLFPYQPPPTSLLAENFTGFAFVLQADGSVRVVAGSQAAQKGVRDGDSLLDIGGGPYQLLSSGLIAGKAGDTRDFMFSRGGMNLVLNVPAEAVLGP